MFQETEAGEGEARTESYRVRAGVGAKPCDIVAKN